MKCIVKITINLGRVAKLNKIVSKSEIRNVIHNAGYMMITQIALYVAPLFILSYLLKTLGVAQFGNYALILSIPPVVYGIALPEYFRGRPEFSRTL